MTTRRQCPECGAKLIPKYQENPHRLDSLECMGDVTHVFPEPNLMRAAATAGNTNRLEYAVWSPDASGRRNPEPEMIEAVELEKFANENRAKFQELNKGELAEKERENALTGVRREARRAIKYGIETGGTAMVGDYKWTTDSITANTCRGAFNEAAAEWQRNPHVGGTFHVADFKFPK